MHEPRSSGASVEVRSDRVIKRQSPDQTRCEGERTEWGARVGRESGRFEVPAILSCDAGRGELVFAHVGETRSLSELLRSGEADDALVGRAGAALAAIHAYDGSADGVSLHGDFGSGNVLYAADRDVLIVIDWATAHWQDFRTTGPTAPQRSTWRPS